MFTKKHALFSVLIVCFALLIGTTVSFAEPASDMAITGVLGKGYKINGWYSSSVKISGGVAPYTFNIVGGALPEGFYIRQDNSDFYVEGIPDKAGSYTFTLRVTDRRAAYAELPLSFTIIGETYKAQDLTLTGGFENSTVDKWYSSYTSLGGGYKPLHI